MCFVRDLHFIAQLSLNELPGATVYARSVSLKNGEVKTGVDLQMEIKPGALRVVVPRSRLEKI